VSRIYNDLGLQSSRRILTLCISVVQQAGHTDPGRRHLVHFDGGKAQPAACNARRMHIRGSHVVLHLLLVERLGRNAQSPLARPRSWFLEDRVEVRDFGTKESSYEGWETTDSSLSRIWCVRRSHDRPGVESSSCRMSLVTLSCIVLIVSHGCSSLYRRAYERSFTAPLCSGHASVYTKDLYHLERRLDERGKGHGVRKDPEPSFD
jgi:hypothetical protein